jgi:hypothetical protein
MGKEDRAAGKSMGNFTRGIGAAFSGAAQFVSKDTRKVYEYGGGGAPGGGGGGAGPGGGGYFPSGSEGSGRGVSFAPVSAFGMQSLGVSAQDQFNALVGPEVKAKVPFGSTAQKGPGMGSDQFRKQFGDGGMRSQFAGLGSDWLTKGHRPFGSEAGMRAKGDRMKALAGATADPKEKMAQDALKLLEKHLPDIAKTLREAVDE